ncbi:MAG: N-acetylneuraminate synthase family protein [Magnetococcales bacterium]|nr:N-acetylneuraminate synthase family protein [Magnetococcales bacterium]
MLAREFSIGGRQVGPGHPPYLIAEIGSNFDQSIAKAKCLIDHMAKAGVDAVKFQLFRADAMQPKGSELHRIFRSLELNPEWIQELSQHAAGQGLAFLASAFDGQSLTTLEQAGAQAHKLASSEMVNFPLIDAMARTGKPLFLATGMCDLVDVAEAVHLCRVRGNDKVAILQCAALYPLPPEEANLRTMDLFHATFGGPVGFSDHSLGIVLAIAAAARGACVIEKHVTLDRNATGPDHFYALEPHEMTELARSLKMVHAALGSSDKAMLPEEQRTGRRLGLYATRDIPQGGTIMAEDLTERRPAAGMRARYHAQVIGSRATRDISRDEPIAWDAISFQEPIQVD